jgi:hypothetical protein
MWKFFEWKDQFLLVDALYQVFEKEIFAAESFLTELTTYASSSIYLLQYGKYIFYSFVALCRGMFSYRANLRIVFSYLLQNGKYIFFYLYM